MKEPIPESKFNEIESFVESFLSEDRLTESRQTENNRSSQKSVLNESVQEKFDDISTEDLVTSRPRKYIDGLTSYIEDRFYEYTYEIIPNLIKENVRYAYLPDYNFEQKFRKMDKGEWGFEIKAGSKKGVTDPEHINLPTTKISGVLHFFFNAKPSGEVDLQWKIEFNRASTANTKGKWTVGQMTLKETLSSGEVVTAIKGAVSEAINESANKNP